MKHAVFCLLLALMAAYPVAAAPARPNIILILADDFGYECVTANGGESYKTPQLDRLAAGGMRFENCHVQPLCTPTRVELMTGLHNVRNYIEFGLMDPKATTFANLLKESGYATGICGKWQLGQGKNLPKRFGFDEACLWQHTRRPPRYANPGLEYDGVEKDFNNGEYGPKLVNDFALGFISRHKSEPFLLYYPMMLTHDPFQPTPDSDDWDPTAIGEGVNKHVKHFADMTAYMDKMIGQLVAKLDELKLRENTLIILLGDNGTSPAVQTRFKGEMYKGGKGTTTARGTHVPLIANWPGKIPAGRVNSDLISSVDFLPTICEAAGVALRVNMAIDGQSFYRQLLGQKGTPREWIYQWYWPRPAENPTIREFAHDGRHKLYRDGRFFNLAADPFEEEPLQVASLTGDAAAGAKALQAALDRFKDARPAELNPKPGAKAKRNAQAD